MYLPKMIGPKKQSKQVDRSRFELDEYMCDLYAGYVAADNDHSPTNKLGLYPCATTERK